MIPVPFCPGFLPYPVLPGLASFIILPGFAFIAHQPSLPSSLPPFLPSPFLPPFLDQSCRGPIQSMAWSGSELAGATLPPEVKRNDFLVGR